MGAPRVCMQRFISDREAVKVSPARITTGGRLATLRKPRWSAAGGRWKAASPMPMTGRVRHSSLQRGAAKSVGESPSDGTQTQAEVLSKVL
jgi:hypothetical protein